MTRSLTVTLREAAELLGISYDAAWKMQARDEFPVPVVRVGRLLMVSRRRLEEFVDGEAVAS